MNKAQIKYLNGLFDQMESKGKPMLSKQAEYVYKLLEQINSKEELRDINKALRSRYSLLKGEVRREAINSGVNSGLLRVGNKVSFQHKKYGKIVGTITKINSKSVIIISTNGVEWRASAGILNKEQ